MKGPSQTLARKIISAFRRDEWAGLLDMVKPRTVARNVFGVDIAMKVIHRRRDRLIDET